jgi:putative thioredoxin
MALSPYVFDATRENFHRMVLQNSHKGPVLVHFWSPKAAPCYLLMPRLVRLATEYAGKFLLVMANTDELPGVAREQSVNSVPTVKLFRNGMAVSTVHGAEPDSTFRDLLDRHIAGDSERVHAEALRVFREGDAAVATEMLARAAIAAPDNLEIAADLAKILMAQGEYGRALQLLSALPEDARSNARIEPLLTHAELITAAGKTDYGALVQNVETHPDDLQARLALAGNRLLANAFEDAMNQLLDIARRDRDYRYDIGRRGLVALFGLLGAEHPLTQRFRRELYELTSS